MEIKIKYIRQCINVVNVIYKERNFIISGLLFTGETQKMNLFQSLTNAMDIVLDSDPTAGILSLVTLNTCINLTTKIC